MQKPIIMRTRSIVDGSLVHCHGACEIESRHGIFFFFFFFFSFFFSILYFYQSIYLFIDICHNHFQTIFVAVYRYNDCKQYIPNLVGVFSGISHMHSMFDTGNVPFDGHLFKC